jgi:uncharacterized protein (TIGR02594 family)
MQMSPWLDLAKRYLGEQEILGSKDNQFILDCFKHTSYNASHDEVPWCAAFICRVLDESGYKSTHSAAAVSFATYGLKADVVPGAIVVFRWADGSHHVSIIDHTLSTDHNYVVCLGGNQSNSVKYSVFPKSRIMATRLPVK